MVDVFTCVLFSESGNVYTCGDCRHGKLGLEDNDNNVHQLTLAVRYQELVVTDVSCGGCHTILVGRRRETDNNSADKHQQDKLVQQKKNPLPPLKMAAPRVPNDNAGNDTPEEAPPDTENNTDETGTEETTKVTENMVNGTTASMNGIDKPEIPKLSDYQAVSPEAPSNADAANGDGGEGHENNNGEAAETILDSDNNVTEEVGELETVKSPRSSGSGVSRVVVEERKKSANSNKEGETVEKPDTTPLPVEPPPKPPRQKIGSAENSQSSRQGSSSSRLGSAAGGKKKNSDGQLENVTGSALESRNCDDDEEKEVEVEGKDEKGKHDKDETNDEKEEGQQETDGKEEKEEQPESELPVAGEEVVDVEDEKAKSDGESTKRSTSSEKSRSAKSKAGTDETVEADIQNRIDDIEDDNVPLETKKEIITDVVHSSAPRTGMFFYGINFMNPQKNIKTCDAFFLVQDFEVMLTIFWYFINIRNYILESLCSNL